MKSLVEYIAQALVDYPDQVVAHEVPGESGGTVIELQVAPDDRGKVIGKRGRMAQSIRALLAASRAENAPYYLSILD